MENNLLIDKREFIKQEYRFIQEHLKGFSNISSEKHESNERYNLTKDYFIVRLDVYSKYNKQAIQLLCA
tara:strand:+ start:460 stop:666 length:207 start_codon:yes stop_codon:yes gene_type:complete